MTTFFKSVSKAAKKLRDRLWPKVQKKTLSAPLKPSEIIAACPPIALDPTLRTREEAQQWFKDNGISVAEWAREHGFKRQSVVDVLHDRTQCTRGAAHRIAVELGIKPEIKPTTLKRAA